MAKKLSTDLDLQEQLLQLRSHLSDAVIGQDKAIDEVIRALERDSAGLHDNKRPIGVFLFIGPTGTGKTHLAEELGRLTQPEENFIRIDCSEYALEHEVAKIYGAPPGYQGAELGSQLTNKILKIKNPEDGFILLLDEIEKAHPRFFDLWLQVFESGRFTDGKGNTLDFGRALIFITSNVGASNFGDSKELGFRGDRPSELSRIKNIEIDLRKTFRPEFLNRLSSTVCFDHLDRAKEERIFDNMIEDLNTRMHHLEISVVVSSSLREKIFKDGFSKEFGARELRRAIVKHVEQPISRKIISGEIRRDSRVFLTLIDDVLAVTDLGDFPLLTQEAS